ncbi:MAG: hypothetical protein J0M20_03715 [Burkholderiales bacterium]|nr:hypothetical protein [Burkholderiales bacterium]
MTVVLGTTAGALLWLLPRQAALERLNRAISEVRTSAASTSPSAAEPEQPWPWHANAERDGSLFTVPVEPRLLEIERCSGDKTLVTRIVHHAAERSTSLELLVSAPDAIPSLLDCLNGPGRQAPLWRLQRLEAPATTPGTGTPPLRQVVLRYP